MLLYCIPLFLLIFFLSRYHMKTGKTNTVHMDHINLGMFRFLIVLSIMLRLKLLRSSCALLNELFVLFSIIATIISFDFVSHVLLFLFFNIFTTYTIFLTHSNLTVPSSTCTIFTTKWRLNNNDI